MIFDEEESLTAKVFRYLWAELVDDGRVKPKEMETKKLLYDWYKKRYRLKGRFPQYHEVNMYLDGYL